jgi:hypothetical protein
MREKRKKEISYLFYGEIIFRWKKKREKEINNEIFKIRSGYVKTRSRESEIGKRDFNLWGLLNLICGGY